MISRHPLAAGLPAVLRELPREAGEKASFLPGEPSFLERFCGGLDGVLAPVFVTLDALEAYVDPALAPADFLPWLRSWVGLAEEIGLSKRSTRAFVREATELYRWQGTAKALQRWVELYAEGEVEVSDNGGSALARDPSSTVHFDREPPRVIVRVRVAADRAQDPHFARGLRALVANGSPAHAITQVEVRAA